MKTPPNAIQPVPTAIPAFIGHTERAALDRDGDLVHKPFMINSLSEYEQHYGGPQHEANLQAVIHETTDRRGRIVRTEVTAEWIGPRSKHLMYYSLQAYFENGGEACYIVSVGKFGPLDAELEPGDLTAETRFFAALKALEDEEEPTLIVIPEAQSMSQIEDMRALYDEALAQCQRRGDRFAVLDTYRLDEESNILTEAVHFRNEGVGNQGLRYGAAYTPNLVSTLPLAFSERTIVLQHLSTPEGNRSNRYTLAELEKKMPRIYPKVVETLQLVPNILPASPFVAGAYVANDKNKGVWKAPANIELKAVRKPLIAIPESQQDQLAIDTATGKSINAIRWFSGRGTLIWGARTLAGNDSEWRYVPVRRFANMLEASVKRGTQFVVFEPNDEPLWAQVRGLVENFLFDLWKKGALVGTKPEHAYFVRMGLGQTMTANDILNGKYIIELGFAPLKPAEFVVMRVEHQGR